MNAKPYILKRLISFFYSGLFLLFMVIAFSIFFAGCKKEMPEMQPDNIRSESSMTNKVIVEKVLSYLGKNTNEVTPKRNIFVKKILENALFDKMYIEKLHENERLIIVPLKEEYFSKNIKATNTKPIQYLILAEDIDGAFRKASLVLFYPKDQMVHKLPTNSFRNFFNSDGISIDGTFTLVSLFDLKQFEADFVNGSQKEFRLWKGKRQQTLSGDCIDWYIVTTITYSDGYVEQDEVYIGTTCGDEQTTLEGSGGADPSLSIPTTRTKIFVVKEEQTAYEHWAINAAFTLQGETFVDPTQNYFTGMSYANSAFIPYTQAVNANPASLHYIVINNISNSTSFGSGYATGIATVKVTYPNTGPPVEWNSYSNQHTWNAAIDLF